MRGAARLGLVLAIVLVGACGDGGDSEPAVSDALVPFVDALDTRLATDSDLDLDDTERRCFAGAAVAIIGEDRVGADPEAFAATSDLTSLGLSRDETVAVGEALVACAPGTVDAVRRDFVDETGVELTADQQGCVDSVIDADFVAAQVATAFGDEGLDVLVDDLTELQGCLG